MDDKYSKYFTEQSLWEKLKKFGKTAGAKVVYAVLLLYYTFEDKSVGLKTKLSIAAALGYFILPTDAIVDLTPLIGFSDDLGVLLFTLSAVAGSITPEIKAKAREKLNDWFGEVNPDELKEIDNKTF
ncbi:YkvA family protein [uncultured Draconibacterium sp.]|uniref:YkvA family protein n=1 Tax=uncultured Draconibacterium sp. TaxID=1573823 RepID=UPI0029C68A0E|nr:YkvA family protein [uncultured Draconibacterium sp.]